MEKILDQEEIDKLIRAAQKSPGSEEVAQAAQKKVTKFIVREVGQVSKEQVRVLSVLHETFARNITNSLGAYLRVGFEVNLVSVEQLSYSEVLSRMPDMTYLCSIQARPLDALALLQMDLGLAFPIMDLVLGGPGKNDAIESRDLTEIEEEIMESVVIILTRELQNTWAAVLEVEFIFQQRQQSSQAVALMPATERTLALSFEIKVLQSRGMLNITIPAVVSNSLLRKLSTQFAYSKREGSPALINQLRVQMLDAKFPVDLRLPPTPVRVGELTTLQLGQVLPLNHPLDRPAFLCVGEEQMFLAYPAACGHSRGGQIQQRVPTLPGSRKAVL